MLAHSIFLQDFLRLGPRVVPSYSLIDRAFKAIRPETWERINDSLTLYAEEEECIDPSTLRIDTTVVETTIHFPTDSSLLWDSFRVLHRLLHQAREYSPGEVSHRFHERKAKKLICSLRATPRALTKNAGGKYEKPKGSSFKKCRDFMRFQRFMRNDFKATGTVHSSSWESKSHSMAKG